jgi:hypothetical protein
MSYTFFGKHFPDANRVAGKIFWDGHFPDGGLDPSVAQGYGPPGVTTFVLDLQNGLTVGHKWITDVQKMRSGKERRVSRNDAPKQTFNGEAYLAGTDPRAVRATLAKYAAIGSQFLLGLPHEMLTLQAASSGTQVFVSAAAVALSDCMKPGQRCVVARRDSSGVLSFVNVVIQSVSGGTLNLDVAPGSVGGVGGWIMPAVPVYLEAQQDFERERVTVEHWKIQAQMAIFDFAPTLATVDLNAHTLSGHFAGAFAQSRRFGALGNNTSIEFTINAAFPTGAIVESSALTTIKYSDGVTTLANLATLLNTSSNFILVGSYNPALTFGASDEFLAAASGGAVTGDVGTGAALTTSSIDGTSRPVWTYPIDNPGSNTDSAHALTTILDHGGVPYSVGTADQADWGRAIKLLGGQQLDWQWFKLFTSTVKGRQRAFWLPTYRDDLAFVSKAAGTVTVSTADLFAWFPAQRQYIQITESSGTITYAKITAAVDNLNGTATLTIGTTLATSLVSQICWLELVRLTSDDISITFSEDGFAVAMLATGVQQ